MVSVAAAVRQFRVAAGGLRAVASVPWVLGYPVVGSMVMVGLPLAGTALLVVYPNPALILFVWAGIMVVVPVAFSFAMVAYCHELDVAFRGERPVPGSGARVALARLKRVVIAGLVVGTGGFVLHGASETLPYGRRLGLASKWAVRVASVFAFPAVATTDATLRETFADVREATESAWGGAAVTTLSMQALGMAVAWPGIIVAFALFMGGLLGLVPPGGVVGIVVVPLVVGVGSLVLAMGVQFAVDGALKTAMYRYAHDGRFPPALAADPEQFVETTGESPPEPGRAGASG